MNFLEIDAAAGPAASVSAMSSEALLSQKSDRLAAGDAQMPILVAEQLNGSVPAHRAKSSKVSLHAWHACDTSMASRSCSYAYNVMLPQLASHKCCFTAQPLTLLPLVALIFYDVSGGPFGIEV